jgi:peroxiredoxin
MKSRILVVIAVLSLLGSSRALFAADPGTAQDQLKALVEKVRTKLEEGKKTPADLKEELDQFDTLLAQHKGEKTDDVAQILLMKAMLYLEVFDDSTKGKELVEQLKRDFPDTRPGKSADGILQRIQQQEEAMKIQKTLVAGAKFPDFDEKDLAGNPLSVAKYKGKVVLIDFWATWCQPCVHELPNVIRAYEKHHGEGFEIIGVSLDQDEHKLKDFTEQMKMSWPQYFDGKGWGNKLALRYGVRSIPATFLLDGEGKIIGKNLRGDALEEALGKALAPKTDKKSTPGQAGVLPQTRSQNYFLAAS